MIDMLKYFIKIFIFYLIFIPYLFGQTTSLKGQISSGLEFKEDHEGLILDIRYIPELLIKGKLKSDREIILDLSGELFSDIPLSRIEDTREPELGLYRANLSLNSKNVALTAGLQKLDFGPSRLLRSLMWFTRLDARDPLQRAEGVHAVSCKYSFLNNASIWVWGLYGNNDLKGSDILHTEEGTLETGGRVEYPLGKGEFGLSYNNRRIDVVDLYGYSDLLASNAAENRLGVDAIWDVGVGIWFEGSINAVHARPHEVFLINSYTFGTDYTFLSGLHVLAEHMSAHYDSGLNLSRESSDSSALSLDMRIGLLDSLNLISYLAWQERKIYHYLAWNRYYDNFSIHLMGHVSRESDQDMFTGTGVRLMVTYNH